MQSCVLNVRGRRWSSSGIRRSACPTKASRSIIPRLFTVETRLPHFVEVVSNRRPYKVSAFGEWVEKIFCWGDFMVLSGVLRNIENMIYLLLMQHGKSNRKMNIISVHIIFYHKNKISIVSWIFLKSVSRVTSVKPFSFAIIYWYESSKSKLYFLLTSWILL